MVTIVDIFFIYLFQFEYLSMIDGSAGDKNGSKIIRSVVFATISKQVLCRFTWTGRSKKSSTKFNFAANKNIVRIFFDVKFSNIAIKSE